MPKQKQKFPPMTTLGFVGRWTGTYVLGWVGLLVAALSLFPLIYVLAGALPIWLALLVWGSMTVGRLVGEQQERLLRRKVGIVPARWQFVSGIMWLVLGMGLAQVIVAGGAVSTAIFALIFALPALAQAYLLHKVVPQAWLWVLAAATSGLIFSLPLAGGASQTAIMLGATLGIGGLLHGAVMAMTLVWLFNLSGMHNRREENIQESEHEPRYAHLQVEEQVLSHNLVRDHIDRVQQRRGR